MATRAERWDAVREAILCTRGALPEPVRRAIAAGDDPPELAPLLDAVRRRAYTIRDEDVGGLEPDVVLEATLAAALGVALERRARAREALR